MITCVRCGAESDSDDYCDQCGASLAPIPPVVPMPSIARACPQCDVPFDDGEVFCETCGCDLANGEVAPDEPPERALGWELTVGVDPRRWRQYAAQRSNDAPPPTPVAMRIEEATITLGRGAESERRADIDLAAATRDTGISRVHARLEPRGAGDGWLIVDLDSANGTMVNAVRVEDAPCPVYEGDVVFVGMWTALALRRS
jgi:uncharacterized Zn finger protein (UPF0148 family)